jgi:Flp pilus assembly protein TadD
MTMHRCSILLAALLAVPAAAAHVEDGGAAEQVRQLDLLASLAGARGDVQEAETLLRRARALATSGSGVSQADLARVQKSMAALLVGHGAVREAERLASRARKAYEKVAGPQHADLANPRPALRAATVANLGALRMLQGRYAEAEPLLEHLAALERLDKGDSRRAAVLHGLASLYATQGRRAEADRIERARDPPRAMLSLTSPIPPAAER